MIPPRRVPATPATPATPASGAAPVLPGVHRPRHTTGDPHVLYARGTRVIIRATESNPDYNRAGVVERLSLSNGYTTYGVREDGAAHTAFYGVVMAEVTWCEGWQLTRA